MLKFEIQCFEKDSGEVSSFKFQVSSFKFGEKAGFHVMETLCLYMDNG